MDQAKGQKVSTVLFPDGERLPILLNESGVPPWAPSLYATSQLRNASMAPSTTRAALDSIKLLIAWAASNNIDIEDRFARRRYLVASEIESLANHLRNCVLRSSQIGRVVAISRSRNHVRAAAGKSTKQVDWQTAYNDSQYFYPPNQFDETGPRREMLAVLGYFNDESFSGSDLGEIEWLFAPHALLDGRMPAAMLLHDPCLVLRVLHEEFLEDPDTRW